MEAHYSPASLSREHMEALTDMHARTHKHKQTYTLGEFHTKTGLDPLHRPTSKETSFLKLHAPSVPNYTLSYTGNPTLASAHVCHALVYPKCHVTPNAANRSTRVG